MTLTTNEETPLLNFDQNSSTRRSFQAFSRAVLANGTCLAVALPTSALNALAAASGDATRLGQMKTPADLSDWVSELSGPELLFGLVVLLASESVFFYMNKLYFFASAKAVWDLLGRDFQKLFGLNQDSQVGSLVAENILFLWSIATSLIFAEIGAKTFSFFGLAGEITGFSLSLGVYFSTRFAGAKMYFSGLLDENAQRKQKCLQYIQLIEQAEANLVVPITNGEVDIAIRAWLSDMSTQQLSRRKIAIHNTVNLIGKGLVLLIAFPVMVSFIPESVGGLEMLTGSDIGRHAHYQNAGSFAFGILATMLTLFFYALAIESLPHHLLRTAQSVVGKASTGDKVGVGKLLVGTMLAAVIGCLGSIGFELVATTAIANESLSYLPDAALEVIPGILLLGIIMTLWSHLQVMVNSFENSELASSASVQVLNDEPNTVSAQNIEQLLTNCETLQIPDFDFSAMGLRKLSIFCRSPDASVSTDCASSRIELH